MAPVIFLTGAISVFADCQSAINGARELLAAQNIEAALTTLAPCLSREPTNGTAQVLQGNLLYLAGRDTEALITLEAVVRREPRNLDARYAIGRIHYFNARYENARDQFAYITASNPAHYRAWDNLGLALEGSGDIPAAIQAHLKAIALVSKDQPEYDWAYGNLAELLMKQNDNRKAFDLAVEAAGRNPGNARNFYLAAKALTRLEQWPKSERWLKQAITLDPTYPEPHYLLGQFYRRQGRLEESTQALTTFKELRAKAPDKKR